MIEHTLTDFYHTAALSIVSAEKGKTMSKIKAIDDPFPQEFIEMFANMALRLMYENEDWIKDYEQETGKSPFAVPDQEAAS